MAPNETKVLRRRAEFLAVAAQGKKWITPAFIVQVVPSLQSTNSVIRFGLTASRKIGGAVIRNRARRRLRALACDVLPSAAKPGYDFVIIARTPALTRDYQDLKKDLLWALRRLDVAHV